MQNDAGKKVSEFYNSAGWEAEGRITEEVRRQKSGSAQPLVSIITAVYNGEKHLEGTIRCVRSQSYQNIEYIIIDGGSTDGTVDIIKKHDKEIDCWVSEPDKGISDAFNKGIRASSGEIIGIINAGDRYAEGAVASAMEAFSEAPEYDFVYGDLVYTDESGEPLFLMKGERDYLSRVRYMLPAVMHPTVFMRKSVYETCGVFDCSYRIAMDYEHLLRISISGKKGKYINKPIAYMALGGISQFEYYRGYKEVCRASIEYGYNPVKAYLRLYLKGIRGLIRVALEFLGLSIMVSALRRIFWDARPVKGRKGNK